MFTRLCWKHLAASRSAAAAACATGGWTPGSSWVILSAQSEWIRKRQLLLSERRDGFHLLGLKS